MLGFPRCEANLMDETDERGNASVLRGGLDQGEDVWYMLQDCVVDDVFLVLGNLSETEGCLCVADGLE